MISKGWQWGIPHEDEHFLDLYYFLRNRTQVRPACMLFAPFLNCCSIYTYTGHLYVSSLHVSSSERHAARRHVRHVNSAVPTALELALGLLWYTGKRACAGQVPSAHGWSPDKDRCAPGCHLYGTCNQEEGRCVRVCGGTVAIATVLLVGCVRTGIRTAARKALSLGQVPVGLKAGVLAPPLDTTCPHARVEQQHGRQEQQHPQQHASCERSGAAEDAFQGCLPQHGPPIAVPIRERSSGGGSRKGRLIA